MDFGNAQRAAPGGSTAIVPRADVIATQGGVAVDLAPEKTVQSVPAGDAVKVDVRAQTREDASQAQAQARTDQRLASERQRERDLRDVIERRLVIEPRTRSIVIQKRDRDTGETVELVPDEATLKLRIYMRQLADRDREAASGRYVERSA